MNAGAFGENFPYTNFHDLNMDWIIKIAKDFLDQYTHLQETIANGEQTLTDLTTTLQNQLQEAYNGYTEQLREDMADTLEQLDAAIRVKQTAFQAELTEEANRVIASIPSEYGQVTNNLKSILANSVELALTSPWNYFYGNGFFNANLEWQENQAITTLKIPLRNYDYVVLSSAFNMQDTITSIYHFTYENADGTKTRAVPTGYTHSAQVTDSNYEVCALGYGTYRYVYIAVLASVVDSISVKVDNHLYSYKNGFKYPSGIYTLTPDNTTTVQSYFDDVICGMVTGVRCLWRTVSAGDRVDGLELQSPLTYYGSYKSADGNRTKITAPEFTAPSDGIICIFKTLGSTEQPRFIPANRFKLLSEDIEGLQTGNPYNGLNAVAFGTSLTYRAQTTGGYLNYLPTLSGMAIDNQGIGSATIKKIGTANGDIMTRIRSYSNYANKRVVILEGFVNDWYHNAAGLGTYTDTGESTVCGCVRTAIDYILHQNPNATLFLVLDHYGRNYGGTDTSSTAKNSNNQTQYQWYEEIAKVAGSMGVHVIPLYKLSGISEYTPQYLMDNIHPTALGAEQTAHIIWDYMRQYEPNVI